MNAHASGGTATNRKIEVVSVESDDAFHIPGFDLDPKRSETHRTPQGADAATVDATEPRPTIPRLDVSVPPPSANLRRLASQIADAIPRTSVEPDAGTRELEPQHRFQEATWHVDPTHDIADAVLKEAKRDAAYVVKPNKIDIAGDVPVAHVKERLVADLRTDDGFAPPAQETDAPAAEDDGVAPAPTSDAVADDAFDRDLAIEAATRRKRKTKLISRIVLGLAVSSFAIAGAWTAYAYLKSSATPTLVDSAPTPAAPKPQQQVAAPKPTQQAAAPVAMAPAQEPATPPNPSPFAQPTERPLPMQPPTAAAPPAASQAELKPVQAPTTPVVAPPAPQPQIQIGPISTRLASLTCRSFNGGEAQILISVGIWQVSQAFTSALDDIAKWTGMQNGMVLFDATSRPDLSKVPPTLAVLAYSGPDQQVASANDVNAKAWIVVSQKDLKTKNADPAACSMRIIAPEQ